jgi:hypothetical protein
LLKTKLTGVDADGGVTGTGRDLAEKLPPSAREHWWVYFGTVAPDKVEFDRTPANLLPGVEARLAAAITKGDAKGMAEMTEIRDQMLGLPAGASEMPKEVPAKD